MPPVPRAHRAIALWVLTVWALAAIEPRYPRDWLLENLLVVLFAGLLLATYRRFTFSTTNYALFAVFLSLHLIGGHYTYSEVPMGLWVQDWLGLSRNHFDRVVHGAYGLLNAGAFREALRRAAGVHDAWCDVMAIVWVLAFSAFFECLEAVVAMLVSPELGLAYLGAQGDPWDAQKDTLLALGGAILAMVLRRTWLRRRGAG